jgi:hypothetical protein
LIFSGPKVQEGCQIYSSIMQRTSPSKINENNKQDWMMTPYEMSEHCLDPQGKDTCARTLPTQITMSLAVLIHSSFQPMSLKYWSLWWG